MAFHFDGVDDYLSVAVTDPGYPVTIAAWINPTEVTDVAGFASLTSTSDSSKLALMKNAANLQARAGLAAGTSSSISAAGTLTSGNWSHGVAQFDSDTLRKAFLGGAVGSNSTQQRIIGALNRVLIAANSAANGTGSALAWFGGDIAWVAIWAGILNADQINSLAKGFSPEQIAPQILVNAWWLLRDLSGIKGGTLTVNGAPTVAPHPRGYT
ncbi:MAG: LamG-like jellyroll fold domain-containing protein [Panacagrimonas sp.]